MNRINGIPVIGIEVYNQLSGLVSTTNTSAIDVNGNLFNVMISGVVFPNDELVRKTMAQGVYWSSDVLVYELCRYDPKDPLNEQVNINRWIIEPSGNVAFVKKIPDNEIPGHHSPIIPERYHGRLS